MIILAVAIATPILSIAFSCAFGDEVHRVAKSVVRCAAQRFLYSGFKCLAPTLALERREGILKDFGAEDPLFKNRNGTLLDALYIAAPEQVRTGNVLILALNTTYQAHHPDNWRPFYENGSDILLWNPTELGGISYSKDLSDILRLLRRENPHQIIAIKTYCASSDPAISAALEANNENVHLLIDRGFGGVQKLARSMTVLAKHSIVRDVLEEKFDCKSIEKIERVRGKCLFFVPEVDQVVGNLTRELQALRPESHIVLLQGDHWSKWDARVYHETFIFLAELGIIHPNHTPIDRDRYPSPDRIHFCKAKALPLLTKSLC